MYLRVLKILILKLHKNNENPPSWNLSDLEGCFYILNVHKTCKLFV